jgi:hypothetical protein
LSSTPALSDSADGDVGGGSYSGPPPPGPKDPRYR